MAMSPPLLIPFFLTLFSASPALAYIGPTFGTGALALVFGILAALGMAFLALLWYPIKRLLVSKRKGRSPELAPSPGSSRDVEKN
jgi:hypothetical protein